MKKLIIFMSCFITLIFSISFFEANADTSDYKTFSEVMMSNGKLLENFTKDEMNECLKNVHSRKLYGFQIYIENQNVDASYISNTLYSVENTSSTDITYEASVDVEKNNKVSISASGGLSGSFTSGKANSAKKEIGGKCGIEISSVTTSSSKEKESMKIVVESNSKMIMYLTGNLSITNGVAAYYNCFFRVYEGGFEIVTLKNQYTRIEKAKIWENCSIAY